MDESSQPDDGSVWNPNTNQTARPTYIQAEASSSVSTTTASVTLTSLSAVPSFSQSAYNTHGYQGDTGVRGHYQSGFEMQGSHGEVYCAQPAQSSYERISPVDGYQDVTSGSDVTEYQSIRRSADQEFVSTQQIDSSTVNMLQQSYHVHQLVVDSDNRVVAVQRVISPTACTSSQPRTSSQSFVSLHQQPSTSDATQDAVLIQPSTSGQHFVPIPVSSIASYCQSEVTTSGGSPSLMSRDEVPGEVEVDQTVSSISGSLDSGILREKSRDLDNIVTAGEPDTTQGDDEDEDLAEPVSVGGEFVAGASSLDGQESVLRPGLLLASSHTLPTTTNVLDSASIDRPELSSSGVASTTALPLQLSSNRLSSTVDDSLAQQSDCLSSSMLVAGRMVSPMATSQMSAANQIASLSVATSQERQLRPTDSSTDQAAADSSAIADHLVSSMVLPTYIVTPDDPGLGPSMEAAEAGPSYSQRRKSSRLAEMENEPASWQKPQYKPKAYNPDEIWCDECMTTYSIECPTHKLQLCPDKLVFSRAWASLPPILQIFRLADEESPELGVFAKRSIGKMTQFGPFIAELVSDASEIMSSKFKLMVEAQNNQMVYYKTADENKCNWMMFVRPATTFAEMNLVAYQHGQDIYFTVTKTIESKQELKVWYATHYGDRLGFPRLEITNEDIEFLDQQECKFQCYECQKPFRTAIALQRHLLEHEEPGHSGAAESSTSQDDDTGNKQKRKRLTGTGLVRKKLQSGKKIKDLTSSDLTAARGLGVAGGFHWKKRSTNIYLNKTLKKYQKRHDAEAIRKSMQSLYRKAGNEAGGHEWLCTHCDLTFDNSNLLNLHTLTHAAEDVGLDEIRKFTYQVENGSLQIEHFQGTPREGSEVVSMEMFSLACPVCQLQFANKTDLIEHAAEHAKAKIKLVDPNRPHKCDRCWKSFTSSDRLQRHLLVHGDEDSKPLQCTVCFKRFMNNSAMSCHMKTHSANKYYQCPICHMGFDQTSAMREHSVIHANTEGLFPCPECDKQFAEFLVLKKHIRGFHTNRYYPCPQCDKVFPRPDKLRLHMLRHSSHREFMCETCGRQFKRKDKLKEHIKRMHSLEREQREMARADRGPAKKFIPKVLPTDYHRFIYKCHSCQLGFKRRGMLVNHLAKKHPDIKPDTVPELNLPILKTQRDYYCQYCEKVYKSSSKRKAHIIKNHPGADLPISSRKKTPVEELPGIPNPTYSQTVGSITTMPHSCEFCHKQYASKAKLTQHQRKKHSLMVPPAPERHRREHKEDIQPCQEPQSSGEPTTIHVIERYATDSSGENNLPAADLLTQAMSELSQSLQEFRHTTTAGGDGTYHLSARLGSGPPTMVQIQTAGTSLQGGHQTIELSHLSQALQQFAPAQGTAVPIQVAVSAGTQQVQIPVVTQAQGGAQQAQVVAVDQVPQPALSPQAAGSQQAQTVSLHPVSLVSGNYIPRTWTNYNYR